MSNIKHQSPLTTSLAAILALITSALAAQPATKADPDAASPSELLEKAIFTEETLGDLDQAIGVYQEILSRAEADASFVAQAQFRLGMCFAKMGRRNEAVSALQTLVSGFPAQRELVGRAKARLADLGVEPERAGVAVRQIWAEALELSGAPSPDGRYLTYTDWGTGDLALRDLETGTNRPLTGKGSWATDSYAEISIFSPDGRQVAYSWFTGPGFELRVIGLDGSGSRVAYRENDTAWLQPLDWSSDGEQILTWLAKDSGIEQLALISVKDGTVRVVNTPEYPAVSLKRIVLSGDGEHVVFSRLQDAASTKYDVFLHPLNGGATEVVVEHAADDIVLGWSPDGGRLLFASDRRGEWGAWSLSITGGKASGQPELVLASLGDLRGAIFPMGFTQDGSFYYGLSTNQTNVYEAELEGSAPPRKATERYEGANSQPDWSADGSRLAWMTQREGEVLLMVKDLESGEVRELALSPKLERVGNFQGLRWSPDGQSFLVAGVLDDSERAPASSLFAVSAEEHDLGWWGILTIDAATGDVAKIARGGALRHAIWAPDGRSVYFERRLEDRSGIIRLDLESGEETTVLASHVGSLALSPDGRWLAYTTDHFRSDREHALRVISTAGAEQREVYRSSTPFFSRTPLAWMPDSRSLIFGTGSTSLDAPFTAADASFQLWKISIDGGEPEKIDLEIPHLAHLRVHPDGRRIVFDAGERRAEIWALENFLPGLEANR